MRDIVGVLCGRRESYRLEVLFLHASDSSYNPLLSSLLPSPPFISLLFLFLSSLLLSCLIASFLPLSSLSALLSTLPPFLPTSPLSISLSSLYLTLLSSLLSSPIPLLSLSLSLSPLLSLSHSPIHHLPQSRRCISCPSALQSISVRH